jgi:hypothetical protein
MKRLILCLACLSLILTSGDAYAVKNSHGSWTLHFAGPHDAETNTCDYMVTDCMVQIVVDAPPGPGRYDVYVIATDVVGIAQTSFGLSCDGSFTFHGWTGCGDSEVPDTGWPGCGEGITVGWMSEQPGPHVTVGILDVYVDGTATVCSGVFPSLGKAEFCDGSIPDPVCAQRGGVVPFGCVGFGSYGGYATCPAPLPPDQATWGLIKSLYVE